MAKDRNTIAKRQRDMEKKRKAEEKRQRRAKQKQRADEPGELDESGSMLSQAEQAVLSIFRKYLMTPGKMLCFDRSDLEAFNRPLAQLTNKGLLVAEASRGGYSLTETGFAAMQDSEYA